MKDVLKRIKELRMKKGFSQEYMGAQMKIGQSTYGLIENGKRRLTVDALLQIAIILDCPVEKLIEDAETLKDISFSLPYKNSEESRNVAIERLKIENEILRQTIEAKDKIIYLLETQLKKDQNEN